MHSIYNPTKFKKMLTTEKVTKAKGKAVTKTKYVSNFTNGEGKKKQIGREKYVNYVMETGIDKHNILSLSADNCITELMLQKKLGPSNLKLNLCENDTNVFKKLLQKVDLFNEFPPSFNFCNIADKIYSARKNEYTSINGDYCCQIGAIKDEVEYTLKSDIICLHGIYCINVAHRSSGNRTADFLRTYLMSNPNRCKQYITDVEWAINTFLNRQCEDKWQLLETYTYKDIDEKGNPHQSMITFILKRIK